MSASATPSRGDARRSGRTAATAARPGASCRARRGSPHLGLRRRRGRRGMRPQRARSRRCARRRAPFINPQRRFLEHGNTAASPGVTVGRALAAQAERLVEPRVGHVRESVHRADDREACARRSISAARYLDRERARGVPARGDARRDPVFTRTATARAVLDRYAGGISSRSSPGGERAQLRVETLRRWSFAVGCALARLRPSAGSAIVTTARAAHVRRPPQRTRIGVGGSHSSSGPSGSRSSPLRDAREARASRRDSALSGRNVSTPARR